MSDRVVWAPFPGRVELETERGTQPLQRSPDGWWSIDAEFAGPYRLIVDGDPLPDPRSPWQPDGVEGWSHTLDHASFVWTDMGWTGRPLGSAVITEIHVGTFTAAGTFDAAIERLTYLAELGVTAVELMPIAEFPGERGWGYDGVLLSAPHHAYGGPHGLQRFVDAAHGCGLAVIVDVVYNHLGPSGNHLGRFGPYFTDEYRTPWGDAVNLDSAGSDEVRRFFIDNACGWVRDFHVDGLRLDAVHAMHDRSAIPFVEELAAEVHDLARHLGRAVWVIAEHDGNDPRAVSHPEAGGLGLDALWNDDFHHALHAVLTGERDGYYADFGQLADLARTLERVYVHEGGRSGFRNRRHGRAVGTRPRDRFIGYAQTHDQIGNRAHGERLSSLVTQRRAELAAAIVLTSPFVPMIFQGEEWGASSPFLYFTDHQDPDLARSVSEGRRREFSTFDAGNRPVPDPQAPSTFEASKLDWSEREHGEHASLLHWHRQLLSLRRATPDLTTVGADDTDVTFDEDERWMVVRRGSCVVACNFGARVHDLPTPGDVSDVLLTNTDGVVVDGSTVRLAPDGVVVARFVAPTGG